MTPVPTPPTDRFRLVPVGPGAWAAIGNRARGVPSNAGIIDLQDAVLIVDSFPTLQAAEELRTVARVLTGGDPSAVITTHWHPDHWIGNPLFADCKIFGTAVTRDRMQAAGPAYIESVRGDPGAHAQDLLDARCDEERRPLFREELEVEQATRRDLYERSRALWVKAPNQTFETRYRMPARRSVWFVEVSGHTESDTMVFLPDSEVLFAGDIVARGVHPNVASGRIDAWRKALAGVEKIRPAAIVPGHGGVGDLTMCDEVREYLGCLEEARAAPTPEEIPERFRDWLSPSAFGANVRSLMAGPGEGGA